MADFVAWLRHPAPGMLFMQEQEAKRQESTVNVILSAVVAFYAYHERIGNVAENSLFRLQTFPRRRYKSFLHHIAKRKSIQTRLVKLKQPKNLPKTLTSDQVKHLVEACHRTRDKFLVGLLYETGMRIGQALGLKHEDIRTWANTIRVVPRDDNSNGARAKQVDPYTIDVSSELMALYRDYLVDELDEVESEYVFVNLWQGEIGQPLKYETVIALFRRLSKKIGFYVYPHLLRHTHATELIRSGWDAAYVQKRLGHAHIQTTMNLYTHLDEGDLKQAYQDFLKHREGQ